LNANVLKVGDTLKGYALMNGTTAQMRFMLENRQPFILNISCPGTNLSAFLSSRNDNYSSNNLWN